MSEPEKQTNEKRIGQGKPGPGRHKGIPNKNSTQLKEMILAALSANGGEEYLARQAKDNPTAFLTLIGKVLPMTIAGDATAPLSISITRRIIDGSRPED